MKRNGSISLIMIGIAVVVLSLLFSSGYHPRLGFFGSIERMEVVLVKGTYRENIFHVLDQTIPGVWEGRVSIPIRYPLAVSVLLIVFGTGSLFFSKKDSIVT